MSNSPIKRANTIHDTTIAIKVGIAKAADPDSAKVGPTEKKKYL